MTPKSKILMKIEEQSPILLSVFLEQFSSIERKSVEMDVTNLASEGELKMERISSGSGAPDYLLSRRDSQDGPADHNARTKDATTTNCWMLRFSPKLSSHEILGRRYVLSESIPNARDVKKGDKAIWFESKLGRIRLWGFGDVERVGEENGKDYAFFDNFKYFGTDGKPLDIRPEQDKSQYQIPQHQKELVQNSKRWNPRNSIVFIDLEIYKMLIGEVDQFPGLPYLFPDIPLSIPNREDVKRWFKQEIEDELLIDENTVLEIVNHLASGRHVLLAGPVGTGKTRLAMKIPFLFRSPQDEGYLIEEHTATSEWTTFDVIGGIVPKTDNGKPMYDINYGCVVDTVKENWEGGIHGGHRTMILANDGKKFRGVWLLIDELNRADIDKAFGQMFTSLRTRKLKIPAKEPGQSYKKLTIPKDYRIFGTLNTIDKNFLFDLSDALKSRFAFVEVGIPKSIMYEEEMFYALYNATRDLEREFDFIKFDTANKKIDRVGTDKEFYNSLEKVYYFLRTVRQFKKLGTAILKLSYQYMVVKRQSAGKTGISIYTPITAIILPQLETLTGSEIDMIGAIHSNEFRDRISEFSGGQNRHSYAHAAESIFALLNLDKKFAQNFANNSLHEDDLVQIESHRNDRASEFFALAPKLQHALGKLSKSSVL